MNRYLVSWEGQLPPLSPGQNPIVATNLPTIVRAETRVDALRLLANAIEGKGRIPGIVTLTYLGEQRATVIPGHWVDTPRVVTIFDKTYVAAETIEPEAGVE